MFFICVDQLKWVADHNIIQLLLTLKLIYKFKYIESIEKTRNKKRKVRKTKIHIIQTQKYSLSGKNTGTF